MTNFHGSFIWYELMTIDPDAAQRFYSDVVGWKVAPFGDGEGMDYRILSAPDGDVGGIMKLPSGVEAGGMEPGWFGYIGVDDVDPAAEKLRQAGGAVHMAPQDIPGVGRIAFVADPQGVCFYIMRGSSPGESRAFAEKELGHCGWNELSTTDQQGAIAFYREQFGIEPADAMDMGPMGTYQFIDHGGRMIGAVMTKMPGTGRPMWAFYFRVDSIAAAIGRIERGGGKVTSGPHQVPGGDHIVVGVDPQGAAFHLVGGQ
jgi:predicted enzyme related to lactoylglutathione lyase